MGSALVTPQVLPETPPPRDLHAQPYVPRNFDAFIPNLGLMGCCATRQKTMRKYGAPWPAMPQRFETPPSKAAAEPQHKPAHSDASPASVMEPAAPPSCARVLSFSRGDSSQPAMSAAARNGGALLAEGATVFYQNADGSLERVVVRAVHMDDAAAPYYTIDVGGTERQTPGHRLLKIADAAVRSQASAASVALDDWWVQVDDEKSLSGKLSQSLAAARDMTVATTTNTLTAAFAAVALVVPSLTDGKRSTEAVPVTAAGIAAAVLADEEPWRMNGQ